MDYTDNKNRLEDMRQYLQAYSPAQITFYNTVEDFFETHGDDITEENIVAYLEKKKYPTFKGVQKFLTIAMAYAKCMDNRETAALLKKLSAKDLWNRTSEPMHRFISHAEFENIYNTLNSPYAPNGLYCRTLLLAIYEGVYSGTFDVFANLRASDIHGRTLTLRTEDGHVYDLEVSQLLADNLIELSRVREWAIAKGDVWIYREMVGVHEDSCFKVCVTEQMRADVFESVRFKVKALFRKTLHDFTLDQTCHPQQFYVSGLFHRVVPMLKEHGLSLTDALLPPLNQLAVKILRDEMVRCNDMSDISTLRVSVEGYIDIFLE